MKATGIVRRIDELGRVVIPKEIRRTMRIREGDPLEIFTDRDGEVILKKYSPIGELSNFAKEYTDALSQVLGHTACICDKDSVVAASGAGRKELLDKPIHTDIEQIIESRKKLMVNRGDSAQFANITVHANDADEYSAQVIVPIIVQGDAIGAIMLISREAQTHMGETELKVAETAAGFLSRQMLF
ncbi:MAG: stage V sporulation protein T [Christensenellales bacterium]|nr:stage V sporulation protein T [Clostridiales bacterium]